MHTYTYQIKYSLSDGQWASFISLFSRLFISATHKESYCGGNGRLFTCEGKPAGTMKSLMPSKDVLAFRVKCQHSQLFTLDRRSTKEFVFSVDDDGNEFFLVAALLLLNAAADQYIRVETTGNTLKWKLIAEEVSFLLGQHIAVPSHFAIVPFCFSDIPVADNENLYF